MAREKDRRLEGGRRVSFSGKEGDLKRISTGLPMMTGITPIFRSWPSIDDPMIETSNH